MARFEIPIIQFDGEYIPNPNPAGDTPIEEFYRVRDELLAASSQHGPTGPDDLAIGHGDYYLVENQYNDEMYQRMDVHFPDAWSAPWLRSLIEVLEKNPPWGIYFGGYDTGQVVLFGDRLMISGPALSGCRDFDSFIADIQAAARDYDERMYGPLLRQLELIRGMLPDAMRRANEAPFVHLATTDSHGRHEGNSIWFLQSASHDELRVDGGGELRSSAVSGEGTIHPQYCRDFSPYVERLPEYWLRTYLVKDKSQRTFKVLDNKNQVVGVITTDQIVRDDELKRRYPKILADLRQSGLSP